MAGERWLSSGWATPGRDYAGNRHNVGFMVLDLLAERLGGRFKAHKGRTDVVEGRLAGEPVVLAKPKSYMNESGGPVAAVRGFFKVPIDRIVVVHDELDIPYGTLRLKRGGGDNGHNGLRSITKSLGSKRLPAGALRHRAAAGPAGSGRLRPRGLPRLRSARTCRSSSTGPPTRWRRWSPTGWSRRRTASTPTCRPERPARQDGSGSTTSPRTPTAERGPLKGFQCGFESHRGYRPAGGCIPMCLIVNTEAGSRSAQLAAARLRRCMGKRAIHDVLQHVTVNGPRTVGGAAELVVETIRSVQPEFRAGPTLAELMAGQGAAPAAFHRSG